MYISFRPFGKDRFIRGSVKSLGKEYTKERIRERIELKRERKATIPKRGLCFPQACWHFRREVSDLSRSKALGNHWEFEDSCTKLCRSRVHYQIGAWNLRKTEAGKSAKQSVAELEHRIKNLAEIIKYAEQYRANRSYHIGYKKAKNPDAYFRRYESPIILYGGARRMLEQAGINLKSLNIDKLKSEYQELTKQKDELTSTYKSYEKEVRELSRKLDNLNRYLEQDTVEQNDPSRSDKRSL